jgi:hypothetical protein
MACSSYEEQVVSRVDEGLVLLQGALVPVSTWGGGEGKTVHALRSHMSALNFRMKPSVSYSIPDLNDDALIWASQNIGGRDAVEEFVSCGICLLSAGVDFEHVKVGLTPIS